MNTENIPEGWSLVKMGDILPVDMLDELPNTNTALELKALCRKYASEIEARGNVPDFIYFKLLHLLGDKKDPQRISVSNAPIL